MTAGTGSDIVWSGAGQRHRVTRHQVIWARQRAPRQDLATAGTASSGKAVGLRVQLYDHGGHWVRHWIVLTGQRGIGSPGFKSFGSTASTASSGKARGLRPLIRVIGTDSGQPDQGYRIIWINSGASSQRPNRIVRLDQFIMLGRGIRPS
ncbi:unnamed protein product, partial [Staurois parvus]